MLHEALELWRDEPLPELRAEPFSSAAVAQLEQLRLRALEERIDADLALGRDATLVTELEALVAEHPYREGLRAQLMLTLYRSGRQAGALDVYQAGRRALQDDLGLEPGKELRDLEAAILRQDEALSVARSVPAEPEPEAEQPPPAGRLSRRAVIAACIAGFAAVALGTGLAVLRSGSGSAAQVKPGSVGVVDPVTRRVVADVPLGFSSPLIAAGEGSVWVVDPEGNTLTRIDPETNAVVSPPRGIPGQRDPDRAGRRRRVGLGRPQRRHVSSACSRSGRSSGICADGSPSNERDAVVPCRLDPVELAVGGGAVWALERGRGELTRIDPARAAPKLLADGLGASSSIAVDRDAVWLGGPDGVRKLDPRTGLELGSTGGGAGARVDDNLDRGRPRGRVVRRRIERTVVAHPSRERVDRGLRSDRESPSAVAVDEDGAVWVASSCPQLALAPGTRRRTPSRRRDRRDLARPRRRLRPDLDEPGRSRRVAALIPFSRELI